MTVIIPALNLPLQKWKEINMTHVIKSNKNNKKSVNKSNNVNDNNVDKLTNNTQSARERYKVRDFYRDVVTHKEHPVSMGWLMDLRADMIAWARDNEDAINPYKFLQARGIPRQTAKDWTVRIPEFAEGFQIAKDFIALRREEKLIEANPFNALAFMMPHYDEDYAKQHEFRSKLKASEQSDQKAHVTVVIPDMDKA